ncbi:MAG TPA: ATP-dependent DNA helicase, partial [Candidatus Paceibacterota bacterium]
THALAELYHAYQVRLRAMKRFDYEDMILETVSAMEHDHDFLLILEEWYQYLLADEHQDTNRAQNRILELLASFYDHPNIFIVGDEKQAIYRFQGASLANFLYFKEKYPDALSIALTENYRSTQIILDGAQALISHEATEREKELRVPLFARGAHGTVATPVTVAHLPVPRAELEFIETEIGERHKRGEPLEKIAVLARKNSDIRALALHFAKRGLPYHMLSEADVLEDEDVQKLVRLLRAVVRFGEDDALVDALSSDFFRLDHLDIWKMIRAADTRKISVYEIMQHERFLKEAGVSNPELFLTIYRRFHEWHVGTENRHVLPLVEDIIRESGLLAELLAKPEGSARLRAVDRLYDELKSLSARERDYRLDAFLSHLETLIEHKKGLETEAPEERPGVRLMSVHKAKGLEFDHVYIMNATERAWEGRGVRTYFRTHFIENSPLEDTQDKNDERRLFYVALTRARHTATITYSESDENGKAVIASRFISDIDPALVRHTAPKVRIEEGGRYGKRVVLEPRALDRDFLRARFLEQGLAATAFNNYLECPWQYVHRNLLRIPGAPDRFLVFGTAIHAALRVFFDHWRDGEDIGVERVIERFCWSLERQPLSHADHQALLEKGEKAIRGYYAHGKGTWPRNVKNEYRVDGIHLVFEGDDGPVLIPLRGSLDKIEIGEDRKVNVVDYKTGKVKSRNALLGKTKEGNKDYVRQLVFYKMLLDKFDKDNFVMEMGTIEFVEPNEGGKFIKETFVVTNEEARELEKDAVEAAKAIYNLSFWGKRCEKEECKFCDLYVPLATQT